MRKLKRSVAHAKMKKMGIERINKPRFYFDGKIVHKQPSIFAENWRKYA